MQNPRAPSPVDPDFSPARTPRRLVAAFVACTLATAWPTGCATTSWFSRSSHAPKVEIDSVASALSAIRESRDPNVRRDAFAYLGNPKLFAGDEAKRDEVVEILRLALKVEVDPNARMTILRSLAGFGSPPRPSAIQQVSHVAIADTHSTKAAAAIIESAGDKDPAVRIAVCRSLGRMRTRDAGDKLDALFTSDPSLDVRLAAAEALGDVPFRESAEALLSGLENPDVALRYRCRQSLEKMIKQHAGDVAAWRDEIHNAKFDEIAGHKKRFGLF